MKTIISLVVSAFIVSVFISAADAGDIYVPSDYPTIQAGIDAAVDGDTVIVEDGLYTGEGNRDILFNGKAITVRSKYGAKNCIVNCLGSEDEPHRGFRFKFDETETSVLDGFTITGGYTRGEEIASYGGGIVCVFGAGPTIKNCIVRGNTAFEYHGDSLGGGIYGNAGVTEKCVIENNSADYGGGIAGCSGPIIGCKIDSNFAKESGGGIYFCSGEIRNCRIVSNSSDSHPESSYFNDSYGGGMSFCYGPISNCLVAKNISGYGGGILNCQGPITNCTIVSNYGVHSGGGLIFNGWYKAHDDLYWIFDYEPIIKNSIIWGNTSVTGRQIELLFSTPLISYSNIQHGLAGIIIDHDTNVHWLEGNISANPEFADSVRGDYRLKSKAGWYDGEREMWMFDRTTSPCIDAGDPASDYSLEPQLNGERINMGAYGGSGLASRSGFADDLKIDVLAEGKSIVKIAEEWLDDNSTELPLAGVAHWLMDEGEGLEVLDSSGNNNHGRLINMDGTDCWVTWGRWGNDNNWGNGENPALLFDGVDDYIAANGVCNDIADKDFVLTAWVWSSIEQYVNEHQFIFSFNTSKGENKLLFGRGHYPNLMIYYDEQWHETWSNVFEGRRVWHFVCFALSDSTDTLYVYVDGELVYTGGTDISIESSDLFSIGQEYDYSSDGNELLAGNFYEGYLSDIRIYDTMLSGETIYKLSRLEQDSSNWPIEIDETERICEDQPVMDLNADCRVDWADVAYFTGMWLGEWDFSRGVELARWKFDEGEGLIAHDSTGNHHDGLVHNFDVSDNSHQPWLSSWVETIDGYMLEFKGENGYISVGTICPDLAGGDMTVAAWVKPVLHNRPEQFIWAFNTGSGGDRLKLGWGGDQGRNLQIIDTERNDTGISVVDNEWHFVALTLSGQEDEINIYVDGDLVYSYESSVSIHHDDVFSIGQEYDEDFRAGNFYHGLMDDVCVFSAALSPEELQKLYEPDKSTLLASWTLDDGQGSVATDSSGNGYDAELRGFSEDQWAESSRGGALSFDGEDDYLAVGSICSEIVGSDFTFAAWVKPNISDGNRFIFALNTEQCGNRLLLGKSDSSDSLMIYDGEWINLSKPVFNDRWHFVALVLNDSDDRAYVYVDGRIVYDYDTVTSIHADDIFSIGQECDDGHVESDFYSGLMDEVKMYSKALSLQELDSVYKTGPVEELARWSLEEGEGMVAADVSGNGHDAVLRNFGPDAWRETEGGYALSFDGVDDFLSATSVAQSLAGSDFTFSGWIKPDGDASGQTIFSFNTSDCGNRLYLGQNERSSFLYVHDGDWKYTGVPVFDGLWHFVALTMSDIPDDGWMNVYVDGQLVYGGQTGVSINSSDIFSIGQECDEGMIASNFFKGLMDDVRLFPIVLSHKQIRDLRIRRGVPKLAWWPLDEGDGLVANDATGNGFDATLRNFEPDQWVETESGYALLFDGVDDFLGISGVAENLAQQNVSFTAWIKSDPEAGNQTICAFNTGNCDDKLIFGQEGDSANLQMFDGEWRDTGVVVFDDTWHFVGFTFSPFSGRLEMYDDGILVYHYQSETWIERHDIFSIGQECDSDFVSSDFYKGLMDDIRLYRKVLSGVEMLDLSQGR